MTSSAKDREEALRQLLSENPAIRNVRDALEALQKGAITRALIRLDFALDLGIWPDGEQFNYFKLRVSSHQTMCDIMEYSILHTDLSPRYLPLEAPLGYYGKVHGTTRKAL